MTTASPADRYAATVGRRAEEGPELSSFRGLYDFAFDDFQVLLQKYPSSRYAGDAWQRMVYIRNRLAEHELHVVDFYVRRGAYMAAAKRAAPGASS